MTDGAGDGNRKYRAGATILVEHPIWHLEAKTSIVRLEAKTAKMQAWTRYFYRALRSFLCT
jgi:hypothetical protein